MRVDQKFFREENMQCTDSTRFELFLQLFKDMGCTNGMEVLEDDKAEREVDGFRDV